MVTDPRAVARFTALYDEFYPRVHAYAVSRTGRQLAEEVAGETFTVAWRRFADLPDPPLPWLIGIARNISRESYRAEARQAALTAELRSWAAESAADVSESVVERTALLRALATLTDDDREVLTLVAWHGLTSAQAAAVLGCTKSAYFVRLHRARKRLEDALIDQPDPARVKVLIPRTESDR